MTTPTPHRATLGEYIRAGRHMLGDNKPKSIRQIAAETGMSVPTVRRWAEIDHYDEWFRWWPSFNAIWADIREGKPFNPEPSQFEYLDITPGLDDERY